MLAKRSLALMTTLAISASALAACGGSGSTSGSTVSKVDIKDGEKVQITFWHAMGANLGDAVNALVDEFNSTQDRVVVNAEYQGSYDEALQKFKAAGANGPTMIQVYEIGSRFMIDSEMTTPMQGFIDADKYDVSQLEDNILNYYTFDGKLHSMPFNTSTPILYYNKDAFRAAGLDPEQPPKTFEEFHEYATKLTNGTTRYGASIALYGWFFEQFLATQNAHYVDNDNGRAAKATKAIVDSAEGQKILTWIKDMVDDGSAVNLGRKTAETQTAFQAGQIAMTFDSTAVVKRMIDGAGDKFEVGTAFLPRPNNDGGVIIGGGSLWITNQRPEKEQWAAWEFIKWLGSPEVQAKWHGATGYFPVSKATYDLPEVKALHEQMPQFTTAVEQLRASKKVPATQGAVIGVFPQARQLIENAMEETVLGQATAEAALTKAAEEITKAIENYNRTTN